MEIYTDGSSYHKDKTGGWAFVVVDNGREIYQEFGNRTETTISVMEMTAVYKALLYIKEFNSKLEKPVKFNIYCDSAFVVNTFNEKWYIRWREMEWFGVKNSHLWQKILKLFFNRRVRVNFIKIKGHSGNFWNDVADYYAGNARKFLYEK